MKSDKTTPNVPTLRFPNYNGEWQKTVMGKVCSFRKGYDSRETNQVRKLPSDYRHTEKPS